MRTGSLMPMFFGWLLVVALCVSFAMAGAGTTQGTGTTQGSTSAVLAILSKAALTLIFRTRQGCPGPRHGQLACNGLKRQVRRVTNRQVGDVVTFYVSALA